LSASDAAIVAGELAEGLVALHQVGVVHRDLTPANVILTEAGAVIVDLGIARLGGGAPLTRTGTTLGTPAWMAPEQLTGAAVGPAVDVFAWGGVVTFAATGRPPFGDGDPAAMGYRIVHTRPELAGLREDLAPIVSAALAPEPADRPTASTLRMAVAGETQITPPPARTEPASPGAVVAPPATSIARNRSTTTPSVPPPRGPRRGPYWPWVVLAAIVGVCLLLVLALLASGGG
jgi:serine/threonine protein kinase